MHVEYAQLPPPEYSADRIFVTKNAVIVLDGATAFVPVPVSAQAYADHLGRAIVDQLAAVPDIDLRDAVAEAISTTATELGLSRRRSPTSTVSILRDASTSFDLLVLGDSPVLWGNRAECWTLYDDRMDHLALPERVRYQERLRAGHGFDDEHWACLRSLQEAQASRRNVDDGYWIAETDENAARNALVTQVPATGLDWVLLLTDGAFDVLKYKGCEDWREVAYRDADELARLLAALQEWEDVQDPDGQHLPRSKQHDDKAIAAVTLGSPRRRNQ